MSHEPCYYVEYSFELDTAEMIHFHGKDGLCSDHSIIRSDDGKYSLPPGSYRIIEGELWRMVPGRPMIPSLDKDEVRS